MNLADAPTGWNDLCRWAWDTSLQASLMIGLVLGLQALLAKPLPARGRYWLSLLVLVRLLMPTVPTVSWSPWPVRFTAGVEELALVPRAKPVGLTGAGPAESAPVSETGVNHDARSRRVAVPVWRTLLQVVWTLGVLIGGACVWWEHWRLARWIRRQATLTEPALQRLLERCQTTMGISSQIRLVASEAWAVPTLWGWWKPVLLLPAGSLSRTESELRMVFLHELAHVRRLALLT